VRTVINTHWHDDHVFGNGVYRDSFPGVRFIAHPASAEDLAQAGLALRAEFEANREGTAGFLRGLVSQGKSFAGGTLGEEERLSHLAAADLVDHYGQAPAGYQPLVPTTLVADTLRLRQGARVIEVLFLGRGHSRGDLVVHLPTEQILAAGDLVMSPVQIVGTTSFPPDFAETVDRLIALHPRIVFPGHGPELRGTGQAETISRMLHSLSDQTRAAIARGASLEETRKSVDLSEFRQAMAGDSEIRRILFSYYVETPAVQRAWELLSGK
jgi:glyoxylase-like metal-dependent hydrolase (beta-lactamase superfamily II)